MHYIHDTVYCLQTCSLHDFIRNAVYLMFINQSITHRIVTRPRIPEYPLLYR